MSDKPENVDEIGSISAKPRCVPERPKEFSFVRRKVVYYFSDDSKRGILKRVILDEEGSYTYFDIETVSKESFENESEISSDDPVRSYERSDANRKDNSLEFEPQKQKEKAVSKPFGENSDRKIIHCIMADKSKKVDEIGSISTKPRCVAERPKDFSFVRRKVVYYFSDDSKRGILKRVILDEVGSYTYDYIETVSEESFDENESIDEGSYTFDDIETLSEESFENANQILSDDDPVSSYERLDAKRKDNSLEFESQDEKEKAFLKPFGENPDCKTHSENLYCSISPESSIKDHDKSKVIAQDRKEKVVSKLPKGFKQPNAVETGPTKLKKPVLNKNSKKCSNEMCSLSKQSDEDRDSVILNDKDCKISLNESLTELTINTPSTEL